MEQQAQFEKVMYIALLNDDDTLLINIPLYIRVADVNPSGMTATREQLIDRIVDIATRRYEKQLIDYYQKLKNKDKSWKQFCLLFWLSR